MIVNIQKMDYAYVLDVTKKRLKNMKIKLKEIMTENEKILNEEVLFLRKEIANDWHLHNTLRLSNDENVKFSKAAFISMPCSLRKGRLSADILLQNYLMKNESVTMISTEKENMSGECDKKPHPWAVFLEARKEAILWMREEMNFDDEHIAYLLSMDKVQVYLIRTQDVS